MTSSPEKTPEPTPAPQMVVRAQRFVVSWVAEIRVGAGKPVSVRVIDVSATGIGIVSDDTIPAGPIHSLLVRVPAAKTPGQFHNVPIQARLVHQVFSGGRNRAGFQIVQIDPAHTRLIVNR
jgi:c-di-GMP-binding flagellar brake protein YcgR